MTHSALRRAAARRSTMVDTYMATNARKALRTADRLAAERQRKGSLTDGFYASAVARIHDTRRMVRIAIQDEMRRALGRAS